MKASDAMTSPVVTVQPDTLVVEAAKLLVEHRISGLPVVAGTGELIGMLSESDLLRRHEIGTERYNTRRRAESISEPILVEEYVRAHARTVADVMTPEVFSVSPDSPLSAIVDLMEQAAINRVPIVLEGKLVGIFTRSDLLRTLSQAASEHEPGATDDETIRSGIEAELASLPWGPPESAGFYVLDGSVHLTGSIPHEMYRSALRALVENAPGVKSVVDELVLIPADDASHTASRLLKFISGLR